MTSKKRASLKAPLTIILLSLIIGALPILGVVIASTVASAAGCAVNEASVTPRPIGPFNAGGLLYTMFVSGWFMLVSVPLGLLGASVGALRLVMALVQRGRVKPQPKG